MFARSVVTIHHKNPRLILQAISLMNMIAIRPICGSSLLVLRVRGGLQDQVVVVLGVKLLVFCCQVIHESARYTRPLDSLDHKFLGYDNDN